MVKAVFKFGRCVREKTPGEKIFLVWFIGIVDRVMVNPNLFEDGPLDELPFPDRELFPISKYKGCLVRTSAYTQMITSPVAITLSVLSEPALNGKWRGTVSWKCRRWNWRNCSSVRIPEIHMEDADFFGGGTARVKENMRQDCETEDFLSNGNVRMGFPSKI